MELVKVISLKRILTAVLIIVLNIALFCIINNGQYSYKIYDNMLKEYNGELNEGKISDYHGYIRQYESDNPDITDNEQYIEAKTLFSEKVEFVRNYKINIENKLANIDRYKNNAMYAQSGESRLELIKTQNDLQKAYDYDVDYSSNVWLRSIAEYKYMGYFIIVIMLIFIYGMQSDSKKLQYIIKSAPNGRMILELKRIIVLLILSIAVVLLSYTAITMTSLFVYNDWSSINGMSGSDSEIYLVSMGMSRLGLVLTVAFKTVAVTFAMSVFLYALINLFDNKNIGLSFSVMIVGIELLLAKFISAKSIFRGIKYINISNLVDNTIWFKYENWGYTYFISDVQESTVLVGLIIILLSTMMAFACSLKKTQRKAGVIERLLGKISLQFNRIFSNFPVFMKELWKILIKRRMLIVYCLMIVIVSGYTFAYKLKYNMVESTVYTFCQNNSALSESELYSLEEELIQEYQLMQAEKDNNAQMVILNHEINLVHYVNEKHDDGVNVSLINQYEYNKLFDERQRDNKELLMCICLITACLLNVGVISFEKDENVLALVRTGRNRKRWIIRKLLINAVVNTVMCAGVYCYYYHSVTKVLDIQRYDILIQSIQAFADYPFNISVRGYIIVNIVTAILGINIFASIATYLSAKINYRVGVLACLSINVLYYIYKIGVNVLHYYTFPGIVTYIDFYGGISVLQICIIVGVVLAGVILNSKVVKLF